MHGAAARTAKLRTSTDGRRCWTRHKGASWTREGLTRTHHARRVGGRLGKKRTQGKRVSVTLDRELAERLMEQARREERSEAWIVRRCVKRCLLPQRDDEK